MSDDGAVVPETGHHHHHHHHHPHHNPHHHVNPHHHHLIENDENSNGSYTHHVHFADSEMNEEKPEIQNEPVQEAKKKAKEPKERKKAKKEEKEKEKVSFVATANCYKVLISRIMMSSGFYSALYSLIQGSFYFKFLLLSITLEMYQYKKKCSDLFRQHFWITSYGFVNDLVLYLFSFSLISCFLFQGNV